MRKTSTIKDDRFGIARWRFTLTSALLVALLCLLVLHLARIQVMPGEEQGFEFLQGEGNQRTLRTQSIAASRGVITDRHGEPLAVSTLVVSIYANPSKLQVTQPLVADMANALGVDAGSLAARFEKYKNKQFMYLKRHMAPQEAERVLALGWSHVYGKTEYRRYYPAAEAVSHVVGFTDVDDRGREGVELAFNEVLSGEMGKRRVLKDLKGRIVQEVGVTQAPEPGRDLRLSIDLRMQYLAYRELKQAVAQHGARSGSVVLLDVESGEILAMANQPSYNPNERSRLDVASLRNRVVTDLFEPGSTMKPLSVMAAMETGRYKPHTVVDTAPGYIRVGKKMLHDPINYGAIDVTRIMTKSSQVGTTKIALDMEPQLVLDMYERVGLGQSTGVGFPGEGVGLLPVKTRWTDIERANFAFGHGLSLTALQLAQAYMVIANHGEKRELSLLRREQASHSERVIEPHIADQMIAMLETVVGPDGTAKKAQIDGYPVAGKTGTIHKVGKEGYSSDRYQAVFAGFAPATNPKLVAVVVVDEPSSGKYFGGQVAGPVFASVVEAALRLKHVPPVVDEQQVAVRSGVSNDV